MDPQRRLLHTQTFVNTDSDFPSAVNGNPNNSTDNDFKPDDIRDVHFFTSFDTTPSPGIGFHCGHGQCGPPIRPHGAVDPRHAPTSPQDILHARDSVFFYFQFGMAVDPIHHRCANSPDLPHQLLVLRGHSSSSGAKSSPPPPLLSHVPSPMLVSSTTVRHVFLAEPKEVGTKTNQIV